MQFHFISSAASACSGLLPIVKEEPLLRKAEIALAQGYEKSKYVGEHLYASVNIYHVGQISGDTQNNVNWISDDVCSASLVDLALKSSFQISIPTTERVYHLLNPYVITYDNYLNLLREADLNFDTVSPKIFINAILTTIDTTNLLVKLSSFFEQSFNKNGILELLKYETVKTVERCEIFKKLSTN
ncbi:unnamed protein product [Rotaria sp. Silwood2]|nr:unnamed protein product [Rotaria sp. Silwood2]CAF4425175.1 unnamed protein product [Rotaria sp. Silwood2]